MGSAARPAGAVRVEVEVETDRLFALLDGLAVHAAMRREQAATGRLTAVLGHYLDEICGREVRLAGKFEQH